MENILVIDDDEKILELVQEVLKNEHYIVETRSYVDNTNIGEFEGFDLILLDIMLPFLDGYEILERIKNIITCPVIFLSAKSSEGAKVKGLMSGADDYITKPFSIRELVARVKVALRRNLKNGSNGILINGLVFNQDSNSIKLDNGEILLTKNEFRIWGNYQCLETNGYPFADVVIMHFDEDKIRKDILQPIIKVKGRLGHLTPILAVIENGSMQDIFSVLKIGVYDYIETIDDLEKYQKKIQDIILWDWYLKKYKGG